MRVARGQRVRLRLPLSEAGRRLVTECGRVVAAAVVVCPCGPQATPRPTTVRVVLAREALVRPR